MEFVLLLGILREALQIVYRNGKIMGFIALFIILVKSIFFLGNIYIVKTFVSDLLFEQVLLKVAEPNSLESSQILTHMNKDIKFIILFLIVSIIIHSIASLLSATVTIIVSAVSHNANETLSSKDLISRTARTWKRLLVTYLYVILFIFIYIFFSGIIVGIIALTIQNKVILVSLIILLCVPALVYFIWLSTIWALAYVVSGLENLRGIAAVSKAAQIIKGSKQQGFLMNLLFLVISVILALGVHMISKADQSLAIHITAGLTLVSFASMLSVYFFVAFTVFYFGCKKMHGERVEIEAGNTNDYRKISTVNVLKCHQAIDTSAVNFDSC